MYFIVAFPRTYHPEHGWVKHSWIWDETENGWAEITGTPYRTYEEAERIGVFAAATILDKGEVKIMSIAELDRYYYGAVVTTGAG
jgi:hypothetical protein